MEVLVNEAPLTRKREEVRKVLVVADLDEPFSKNMCFMSTSVTNGRGKAKITSAGMATQVGQIAYQLKDAKKKGNSLTPLQMALSRLLCGTSLTTVSHLSYLVLSRLVVMTGFFFLCLLFALSVFVSFSSCDQSVEMCKECFERRGIAHVVRCFSSLNIVQGDRPANALTARFWPTVETSGDSTKSLFGSKVAICMAKRQ